jgi:hypothetical protein
MSYMRHTVNTQGDDNGKLVRNYHEDSGRR